MRTSSEVPVSVEVLLKERDNSNTVRQKGVIKEGTGLNDLKSNKWE